MESGGLATTVAHSDMRCCVLIPLPCALARAEQASETFRRPLQNWNVRAARVPRETGKRKTLAHGALKNSRSLFFKSSAKSVEAKYWLICRPCRSATWLRQQAISTNNESVMPPGRSGQLSTWA